MNMSGPFTMDHGGSLSTLSIEVNLLTNIMSIRELSSDIFSNTEATGDRNPTHSHKQSRKYLAARTLRWLAVQKKTEIGIVPHPLPTMSLPTGFLLSSTMPCAISEISYHLAFISILTL